MLSVFFIKIGFVAVCPKQYVRHPVRGASHLFADYFQVNSGVAFYDQFIMNVSNDEAMPKGLHGIAENVATDGLDYVLHEFRPV